MLTKMRHLLPTALKQLRNGDVHWKPALSAAEQTRLTWAKAIQSHASIPAVYREFFESRFTGGMPFPYTVLAPVRNDFFHKTTEKLVVHSGREINILENLGDAYKLYVYPFEKISYVEVGVVLLDAYIKISGVTSEGNPDSITIKFNSVTDHLFTPILKAIRLAATGHEETSQDNEEGKFDHLSRLNFKFMSYAQRSLLAGEKVLQFVLQPEIQTPLITLPGWTYYKILSPTHMSILTDRELIMIREDELKSRDIGRYGGFWDYIPLNKIVALNLTHMDNNLLTLSIQLSENTRLGFLFEPSTKPELHQLLDHFDKLSAAHRGKR
ncbi:MAG: hypothetical protein HY865_06835 [Chloroflexi bacterium]|nr:hypothetical protein [Chloroflexota bacterium]